MKNKKIYTLILTSNTTQGLKKISISQKQLQIFSAIGIGLCVGFIALLTDYSSLARDHLELKNLRQVNQSFEQELDKIKTHFSKLEVEVGQLQDFSRKVKLITTGSNKPASYYGRVSSQANLMDLTSPTVTTQASSLPVEHLTPKKSKNVQIDDWTNGELIVSIDLLKKKGMLIKQDTWNLYSSLLERKEILNNTPSIMPTQGWITSLFGYRNETLYADHEPHFHRGMDIAARSGSAVFAPSDGKITYTGYDEDGYGKLIIIDHGYGVRTYYAHLSEIKTLNKAHVKRGEVIGYVGNTGKSTGPHLHYEVRVLGHPVNPINYVLDGPDSSYSLSYKN